MRTVFTLISCLILSSQTLAHSPVGYDEWYSEAVSRCLSGPDNFQNLTRSGHSYGMNEVDLKGINLWTYNTEKRLPEFTHFDHSKNTFVAKLPNNPNGKEIELSGYFMYGIKSQIEAAFQRGLADYISITDMGYARFYVPMSKWHDLKEEFPNFHDSKTEIYQNIVDGRNTKILYPTAMMFDLESKEKSDHLQWRFVNRNLYTTAYSGSLDVLYNLNDPFNTLWDIEHYKMLNAGFIISANKNACFSYLKNGKKYYFDLTFFSLDLHY